MELTAPFRLHVTDSWVSPDFSSFLFNSISIELPLIRTTVMNRVEEIAGRKIVMTKDQKILIDEEVRSTFFIIL